MHSSLHAHTESPPFAPLSPPAWKPADIDAFLAAGRATVHGFELTSEDVRVTSEFAGPDHVKHAAEGNLIVLLDMTIDEGLVEEGLARHLVNRIQTMRKKVASSCLSCS